MKDGKKPPSLGYFDKIKCVVASYIEAEDGLMRESKLQQGKSPKSGRDRSILTLCNACQGAEKNAIEAVFSSVSAQKPWVQSMNEFEAASFTRAHGDSTLDMNDFDGR